LVALPTTRRIVSISVHTWIAILWILKKVKLIEREEEREEEIARRKRVHW
jgi:hypothetical protein